MKNLVVICVVLAVLGLVKGDDDSVYKKTYRPLLNECYREKKYKEDDLRGSLYRNTNINNKAWGFDYDVYEKTYILLNDHCHMKGEYTKEDIEDILNMKRKISSSARCLKMCADEKYGLIEKQYFGRYDVSLKLLQKLFIDNKRAYAKLPLILKDCYGHNITQNSVVWKPSPLK